MMMCRLPDEKINIGLFEVLPYQNVDTAILYV